jgi:glycosyltransferase involved in cell wall biosynthesis
MKTSFIVIAYNEAHGIENTLRSIIGQRGLQNYEIIVVNDGSTDATRPIVEELAIRYPVIRLINQPNQGRGAARATGVGAATGTYFAFIDADIVLPPDWYAQCASHMDRYDAVSGTAVPDGDASLVHRLCTLKPKVADQTTTVTGSNGFFKRAVFEKVSYNPRKKNGEDVALGYAMDAAGIRSQSIPGLVVDHREYKTFAKSVAWLYETGIGASRQLYEHPRLRMPDIAFFGFVGLLGLFVASCFTGWWPLLLVGLFGYVGLSALMHLHGKFYLDISLETIKASGINCVLLGMYYVGRLVGLCTEWGRR